MFPQWPISSRLCDITKRGVGKRETQPALTISQSEPAPALH